MSSRMVKRYELEILDGRTWLVWRPNDSSETYLTKFVVIDGLKCDFMLGRKSKDEEFNHRETEKAPVRPLSTPLPLTRHMDTLKLISFPRPE